MTILSRAHRVARSPQPERTSLVLACGQTVLALRSDDGEAADWLAEFLCPWFTPAARSAQWQVTLSTSPDLLREVAERRPPDATPRACFALDQEVVSLPAWRERGGVAVDDAERSCLFVMEPFRIDLLGDRATRRWRFTLQWVFSEIAATRLRRTALDLHAAAVEAGGDAILIAGPKGAGKTTLSFHLMRSRRCRWITNDRAFVERGPAGFVARGMATPIKILAPTVRRFPELARGLRPVERPYLGALEEVIGEVDAARELAALREFALSPAQVAHQLDVQALDSAPLGAIVFPEIRADIAGFAIERLEPSDVGARLRANLYGKPSARREATLFEEIDGGRTVLPRELADELSGSVRGYRVALGPDAYDAPDSAEQLLAGLRR